MQICHRMKSIRAILSFNKSNLSKHFEKETVKDAIDLDLYERLPFS